MTLESYWNERLKNNFNLKGVGNFGYPKFYNWIMYRFKKKILSDNLSKLDLIGTVLDVGCGTGAYINNFNGLRYTGIDITEESINRLSKKYEHRFIKGDISNLCLNENFDLVCCFNILSHITDDTKFKNALENISRMSKKYIFIMDVFGNKEKETVKCRDILKHKKNLVDFTLIKLIKIPFNFGEELAIFEKEV